MAQMFGYLFALGCAVIVIAGDLALKLAADRGHTMVSSYVAAGCMLYLLSGLAWFLAMRHISLAQAGVAYTMFSLLVLCALDATLFGTQMTMREYAGIGFAVAAIVLMIRVV